MTGQRRGEREREGKHGVWGDKVDAGINSSRGSRKNVGSSQDAHILKERPLMETLLIQKTGK